MSDAIAGPGGGGDGPHQQAREQQRRVAPGDRAQHRGAAPQHDAHGEDRHALGLVDEQPEGDHEHGADEQRHGAEQPDLCVVDPQRVLELGRDGADRRGVGAVEGENAGQQRDHACARRPSDGVHHVAAHPATGPAHGLDGGGARVGGDAAGGLGLLATALVTGGAHMCIMPRRAAGQTAGARAGASGRRGAPARSVRALSGARGARPRAGGRASGRRRRRGARAPRGGAGTSPSSMIG